MRRGYEKLALVAAGITAGAIGTVAVGEVQHHRQVEAGNKKLKPVIQPAMQSIGELTLKALATPEISGKIKQQGDWGGPTVTIVTKTGSLTVGMERGDDGKLKPTTTHGVEVDLNRPNVDSLGGGEEIIFLMHERGEYQADGQIFSSSDKAQTVWLDVNPKDANLGNTYTLTEKAEEMTRQVLGFESPPQG